MCLDHLKCYLQQTETNLELGDRGEDQHHDGGQQEEGTHYHQHLNYSKQLKNKNKPSLLNWLIDVASNALCHHFTFAAVEEFGSSNSFQITFLSFAQHMPSNWFGCKRKISSGRKYTKKLF